MKNNIGALLTRRAALNPTREALVDVHSARRYTFAELNSEANQLANALLELGVKKGDRVGLLMMNSPEFVLSFFAIAKIGAVVTPLNWRLVASELSFILKDSGCSVLIFDQGFAPVVQELQNDEEATVIQHWLQLDEPDAVSSVEHNKSLLALKNSASNVEPAIGSSDEDLLYIMYTSGTTGLPKGVVHTHDSAFWPLLTIAASMDQQPSDRYLLSLPMFHVGALTPVVGGVYSGVTNVIMRAFEPLKVWEVVQAERITTGLLVPAMVNFMLQTYHAADGKISVPDSVRYFQCGAAPVPVSMIHACADIGIGLQQLYGLTESCGPGCIVSSEDAASRPGTTGKSFFHTDVKIVKPDGSEAAANEVGELLIRGRHVMKEYWNRPEATAETLVDGWLHTGDAASADEEGYVYIQDRIKDMIISGGENIYPAEVENVILAHEQVVEVAVIGVPSDRWGESPLAVVVRSDDTLDEAGVLQHCADKLARYKRPYGAVFIDMLPRNPSGKVLKRELRDQFPGPAPQ